VPEYLYINNTEMVYNKAWTERADCDLLYTIITVKNLGIISGVDWSEIGAIMRSMGYWFTNEGCR
jgi:hypothetical protein